jgi:chemotaxis protein MotB
MVTFSDVISLLVTFFVLILTFSTMEILEFQKLAGALRGGFGIMSAEFESNRGALFRKDALRTDRIRAKGATEPFMRDMEDMRRDIEDMMVKEKLDQELRIDEIEGGLRIRIDGDRIFDPNSDRIRPDFDWVVEELGEIMGYYPNHIVVEGHTDDTFTGSSRFPKGYELAGRMSQAVADALIEAGSMLPERVGTASYGATRPIVSNANPRGRARNRRVDILILERQQ